MLFCLTRRIIAVLFALLAGLMLCFAPWVQGRLDFDEAKVRQSIPHQYGAAGVRNAEKWLDLLTQLDGIPDQQLLRVVNDFWNTNVIGGEDITIWGRPDYWATPLESLTKRAGDCEDYVIGKYFTLLHAGIPASKLRLIYVRAQVGTSSIAHMVLGYYATPDAEPLLLDNLTSVIRPASQRPDLTPVFSFNSEGVYVAGAPASSVDKISNWRGLLEKMRREGFNP